MSQSQQDVGLVADIGATYARFALVQPDGRVMPARIYALNDYTTQSAAIDAYLAEEAPHVRPTQAVLSVASPIVDDEVTFTNHPWEFSVKALREQKGFKRL